MSGETRNLAWAEDEQDERTKRTNVVAVEDKEEKKEQEPLRKRELKN